MKVVWVISLILLGYALTFAFYFWKPGYDRSQHILFRPDIVIDKYSHIYYIGERVFIAILLFIIYKLKPCFQTLTAFSLFGLWLLDYWLFYNDPPPGMAISFAMVNGGILCILLLTSLKELKK